MAILNETPLPIIISGTGPAALLLAHALLRATPSLPFRLYERDRSMTHRAQGYRFVVKGRGAKSCREVLSPEHFELLRDTCGDNISMGAKRIDPLDGTSLPGFSGAGLQQMDEEPLKADRTLMRQALFKGLEDYTTFGKEIIGYEDAAANKESETHGINGNCDSPSVLVRFADGSTVRGALLVGADGAFSHVRMQLMPRVQLLDCEMRMVFGKTPVTPALYAALDASDNDDLRTAQLLNSTTLLIDTAAKESPMFFMFDPMNFGRRASAVAADSVLAASIPSDYVYWALSLRSDRSEAQGFDWRSMDASAAANLAEDLTKSWLPSLRPLVTHQDRTQTTPLISAIMPIPLVDWSPATIASVSAASATENGINSSDSAKASPSLPNQHTMPASSPMVTLIGDAAHAMPPTGGLGATTALTDAAILGAALIKHGVSRRALEEYEAEMREYATKAIDSSLQGGKAFASMRGLEDMKPIRQ